MRIQSLIRDPRLIWLLLAAYAGALVYQAWRLGVTVDEPHHLAAGYAYWLGHDKLSPSDAPPLTRIVGGWIPRLLNTPLRRDTPGWKNQSSIEIGGEILRALDAGSARRLIFLSRLPFAIFPLLTVWLVWVWARVVFGSSIALVLALLTSLEPTMLGHGALIKSDVPAAFAALLFAYAVWRYWRLPSLRGAVFLAAGLLAGVLVKFTLLVLIPIAVGLVAVRGPRISGVVVILALVYVGLLAAYQMDARPLSADQIAAFRGAGFSSAEVRLARFAGFLPWPPQFIRGIQFIGGVDRGPGFPAYMLGRKIEGAAPWYFPFAWAVKFPIALQLLTLAGLGASTVRLVRREADITDAVIWGVPAWLMLFALRSHIHIGFRHILPVLPFLILGAGFALARWVRGRIAALPVVALALWVATASIRIYPHGISYFNEWAGGAENGWRYLADSNIDWGQDFPELAAYIRRHRIPKVRTYLFGWDVLSHYLPPEQWEDQIAPYEARWVGAKRLVPTPGVYAISVNLLLGYFFPPGYEDYFQYFRARRPDGRAGYSIFVYHVR